MTQIGLLCQATKLLLKNFTRHRLNIFIFKKPGSFLEPPKETVLFIKGIFNWFYGVEKLTNFLNERNLKLKVINHNANNLAVAAKIIFYQLQQLIQSNKIR